MPFHSLVKPRRAFSLVELLVVISLIGVLVAILLPSLAKARAAGRSAVCLSNAHQIGVAAAAYSADHREFIVPSYNMGGTGGPSDPAAVALGGTPVDGWAPILDRGGYIPGRRTLKSNAFTCPDTADVEGMLGGQTGSDPARPRGWMDWPNKRSVNGTANTATALPAQGYPDIFRVSYWVNADNPIGTVTTFTPEKFYTLSVGYGIAPGGPFMTANRSSAFVRPSMLIAFADGVYAGKQNQNRIGITDSRIGYRHPGAGGGAAAANAVFADGHAAPISGDAFPRGNVKADNIDAGSPTLYANPVAFWGP